MVGGLVHAIGNDILAHQRVAVYALEQGNVRGESVNAGELQEVLSVNIIPISPMAHNIPDRRNVTVNVAVRLGEVYVVVSYTDTQTPPKVIADLVRYARLGVKHLGIHLVAHMEAVLYLLAILLSQEVATVVCTILRFNHVDTFNAARWGDNDLATHAIHVHDLQCLEVGFHADIQLVKLSDRLTRRLVDVHDGSRSPANKASDLKTNIGR